MRFQGRTAIVTGGAQGIGRAIAQALVARGMRVAICDIDPVAAQKAASELDMPAIVADLRQVEDVARMVQEAQHALGAIDMLVSNAGFAAGSIDGPSATPDDLWQASWDLHVMAHLRACRLLLPDMLERGEGWLVNVASAAGLLSQIGDAPYSATKHAAVSLAQSLAIEHGDQGIHVSVVCPLYVATGLLGYDPDDPKDRPNDRVLTAADVAQSLVSGLVAGHLLILPHPEAAAFFLRRASDTDRWIDGMRRLRRVVFSDERPESLADLHRRI